MKFKSRLTLIGLSLLIGGISAQATDKHIAHVRNNMIGKTVSVKHDGTYQGLVKAYEKETGADLKKIQFIYLGIALDPNKPLPDISKNSCITATTAMRPVKDIGDITEGTTKTYKEVTDRLKRKLTIFQEKREEYLNHVINRRYSQCGESLTQFSVALDDAASMYKLNMENRAEMKELVLKTFKVDPNLYKPEKEEDLLKVISLYDSNGKKKADAATEMIWNFHENMRNLQSDEQEAYLQELEDFFKENIIRNNLFASLVIGYAIKNPEEPKEVSYIDRYSMQNLNFGEESPLNDWLTCPLNVARQVMGEFNTEAGTNGLSFGNIVVNTRNFHKEIKDGDMLKY
jgi:hypothetical protein